MLLCCVVQVALNACSMTMCGLMLESILESASDFVSVSEEALFMQRCRLFAARCLHSQCIALTHAPGDVLHCSAALRAVVPSTVKCHALLNTIKACKQLLLPRLYHKARRSVVHQPHLACCSSSSHRWRLPSLKSCLQLHAGGPAAGAAAHVQQALGGALRGRVPARVLHVLRQCAPPALGGAQGVWCLRQEEKRQSVLRQHLSLLDTSPAPCAKVLHWLVCSPGPSARMQHAERGFSHRKYPV